MSKSILISFNPIGWKWNWSCEPIEAHAKMIKSHIVKKNLQLHLFECRKEGDHKVFFCFIFSSSRIWILLFFCTKGAECGWMGGRGGGGGEGRRWGGKSSLVSFNPYTYWTQKNTFGISSPWGKKMGVRLLCNYQILRFILISIL